LDPPLPDDEGAAGADDDEDDFSDDEDDDFSDEDEDFSDEDFSDDEAPSEAEALLRLSVR
jgi:hypothetical protein